MKNLGGENLEGADHDTHSELAHLMSDPTSNGVVISGPIGSARMELLLEVVGNQLLDAVHLLCSPVSCGNPVGALSPLLSDFEGPSTEVAVLRHLSQKFSQTSRDQKSLIIVEEAHFLDVASAFVLSQLALAGLIKLVLLAVAQGQSETVVSNTELGAQLGRITLTELSLAEVEKRAGNFLGSPVTSATGYVIAVACAGNAILIDAFLRSAREQTILVKSHGRYVLKQTWLNSDLHLAATVSEIQGLLSTPNAKALEILALGGAEEVSVLEEVSGATRKGLLATGLVRYVGETRIEIAAPLYGQILRDLVPPGRSSRLRAWTSAQIPAPGSLSHSLLWDCECGENIRAERLREAISQANENFDFDLAWRLCQFSGILKTDPQVAVQAARALVGLGRYHAVEGIVDRVLHQIDDIQLLREIELWGAAALWCGGKSHDEIRPLLQRWKLQADILESGMKTPGPTNAQLSQRAMASMELWSDLDAGGNSQEILDRARLLAARSDPQSIESLMAREIMCAALMAMGRFVEAADTSLQSLQWIPEGSAAERIAGYRVVSTALKALFASGDYARLRAVVETNWPSSPELRLGWSGTFHFWAAFASIQEGRWDLADNLLSEAIAELAANDPQGLSPLAESLVEFASFQLGTDRMDKDIDAPADPEKSEHVSKENFDALLLAGAYRSVSRASADMQYLETSIEMAHGEARTSTELQLLILLWQMRGRNGRDHKELPRLHELSAVGKGRRHTALADAVLHMGKVQTVAMMHAAEELYARGETGLGAELLAVSIQRLEGSHNERQRGLALRKLASWIEELGGKAWGLLIDVMNERVLTSREKDIIALARQGKSNKEIADALTISQRTVEGHIYRVFFKLGINRREELDRYF